MTDVLYNNKDKQIFADSPVIFMIGFYDDSFLDFSGIMM